MASEEVKMHIREIKKHDQEVCAYVLNVWYK